MTKDYKTDPVTVSEVIAEWKTTPIKNNKKESKWIEEIYKNSEYETDVNWNNIVIVLERIDKLLRQAMNETDNEILSDLIRKEIDGKS